MLEEISREAFRGKGFCEWGKQPCLSKEIRKLIYTEPILKQHDLTLAEPESKQIFLQV